jgi:hypothetical protein
MDWRMCIPFDDWHHWCVNTHITVVEEHYTLVTITNLLDTGAINKVEKTVLSKTSN